MLGITWVCGFVKYSSLVPEKTMVSDNVDKTLLSHRATERPCYLAACLRHSFRKAVFVKQ